MGYINFKDGDDVYIAETEYDLTDPENPIFTVTKTGHLENVTFGDCMYTAEWLDAYGTKAEILDLAANTFGYVMHTTESNTKAEIIADFLEVQAEEK